MFFFLNSYPAHFLPLSVNYIFLQNFFLLTSKSSYKWQSSELWPLGIWSNSSMWAMSVILHTAVMQMCCQGHQFNADTFIDTICNPNWGSLTLCPVWPIRLLLALRPAIPLWHLQYKCKLNTNKWNCKFLIYFEHLKIDRL